jgi:hypothetical protein
MANLYYKVLEENLVQDGIIFKHGLNVLPGDFDDKPETYYDSNDREQHGYYCEHFGFTIYKINDVIREISIYDDNVKQFIAKIRLPDDTKTKTIDEELKVDKIIIEDIISIKDFVKSIPLFAIQQNGMLLKYIDDQTEEICLAAVKNAGSALKYVKNQTEQICLEAVKNTGNVLEYVKIQTEEICIEAMKHRGNIKFVKNQTEEICLVAAKYNPYVLENVKEQTKKICIAAVSKNCSHGNPLQFVKILTPAEDYKEICIAAVRANGMQYKYVLKQYLELDKYPDSYTDICIEAIKQNIHIFHDLPAGDKTFEVCMAAVKHYSLLIQYVDNKMPRYAEICLEAVKHINFNDIQWIMQFIDLNIEGMELICLEAVKKNGMILKNIKNQTKDICYEAVKQNPHALQFVIDQTDEICIFALKNFCQPITSHIKDKTHVDTFFN